MSNTQPSCVLSARSFFLSSTIDYSPSANVGALMLTLVLFWSTTLVVIRHAPAPSRGSTAALPMHPSRAFAIDHWAYWAGYSSSWTGFQSAPYACARTSAAGCVRASRCGSGRGTTRFSARGRYAWTLRHLRQAELSSEASVDHPDPAWHVHAGPISPDVENCELPTRARLFSVDFSARADRGAWGRDGT